jgi:uncharacterized protein YdaU (DUF1376 family)
MKTKNSFELPWYYRQVPRDFMSSPDVEIMTCEEVGSYFLLLQKAWLGGEDCTLPNDPARLAKLARVEKVSDLVLSKFPVNSEGRLYNQRLKQEWDSAVKRSKDASKAAKKSHAVAVRSQSGRNAVADQSQSGGTATNYLIPNTQDTTPNTQKTSSSQAQVVADSSASNEARGSASSPKPGPGEAAVRVTAKLVELLHRENLKPATLKAWAELAERVLTKADEKTVMDVMQWALVDSDNMFWRGRVYSMKHFANSFNTIRQQYGLRGAGTRKAQDPLAARAASLQAGHDFSAMAKGDI